MPVNELVHFACLICGKSVTFGSVSDSLQALRTSLTEFSPIAHQAGAATRKIVRGYDKLNLSELSGESL